MLKLLLKEEKQKIRKDYLFRFLTLLFSGLSVISILFLLSLIPSYFILKLDQKVLNEKLSVAQDDALNIERQRLKEQLSSLQKTLNIVDDPTNQISMYIQSITEKQSRDISLLNINYEKESGKPAIVLQGNANSRQSLASFINSLEQVPEFESVNLPFSSFARDTNIPFSITIYLKSAESETSQ